MGDLKETESALHGYRVLDLTEGGCMVGSKILGDLGADVIKIEPEGGSKSRIAPYYNNIIDPEKSLYWFAYNMNKRGITLDISTAEGQEKFKSLIKSTDIVMESFQPGYMEQLGLGYSDLSKINPGIIMTSITLFGQSGPKAHYKGSDLTAWASGSYLYICGNEDRAPTQISFPHAFLHGGAEAAVGSMTALWYRQLTGEGQHVDVSMQECAMSPTLNVLQMWDVSGVEFRRCGGSMFIPSTGVAQTIYFECKDGYVLIMAQGGNEPFVSSLKRLFEWMDEEGMADDWIRSLDPAVDYNATTMTQETVDRGAAAITKFTETKTKAELYIEGAIKRRILLAPLYNTKDIYEDLQLKFRNYWEGVEYQQLKESLAFCGPFIKLSETPITYRRRSPLIAEHNNEVYGQDNRHLEDKSASTAYADNGSSAASQERRETSTLNQKPFEGIKVVEFAWVAVGPCTSRYLADHGATVVRIESHNRMDILRATSPFAHGKPDINGSMFFGRHNPNKYSVSIDLSNPNGRELAWKLIMWADIVTESFSPGIMQKWELDYENVSKVRPDIIYLSSSMQGHDGPHAKYAGVGSNACALAGFSEISGWPDRMPAAPHGAYTDYICPRFGATALIAALDYRRRTGRGQWLEQSQFETSLHFFSPPIMDYIVNNRIAERQGNRLAQAVPHGVFPCKGDDRWVAIAVFTDEDWQAFCRTVGKLGWRDRAEFLTFSSRPENEGEREKLVSEWTINYTAEQVENMLQNNGVAAAVVAKTSDVYKDEQLKHRNYFIRLNHAVMGEQAYEPQACFILSKTPREITMPSPCLGEHNAYVFRDLLGMTDEEIAKHIIDGSITSELPGGFQISM